MKENVQRFGRFLGGMVIPNIAVFIAWGLTTALSIPTGWVPNETLTQMVAPTQRFLLPTLIACTGGKMVYDVRDSMVGVVATISILAGIEDPMFIGAMVAGPLGGWLMRRVNDLFAGRIPVGSEMPVSNFSVGILGTLLAVLGCLAIEPFCIGIKDVLVICVDFLVKCSLLSLTSLFVEPVRILFLNNAINHGVFTPLGMDQAAEAEESIFFLIEAGPDPGLGLLLAYNSFGKRTAKNSTPSAVIIHSFDDIHEIYFPYILMNPLTVLTVMVGGMSGTFINDIFNSGLVSVAFPGSIVAILRMCVEDSYIGVVLGVIVATAVPFVVATFILKFNNRSTDDDVLGETSVAVGSIKSEAKGAESADTVSKIVFVCDTEMESSAMGATTLIKKLNATGMKVAVEHSTSDDAPKDTRTIIMYKSLVGWAETRCPNALIFPIVSFMGGKGYDEIVAQLTE